MTTKYKLAEQVILRLKSIESVNEIEFSFQEVILFVEQSIGSIVREYQINQVDDIQELDGQLTYLFENIQIHKLGKKYYFLAPATAISLPMGRGIQEVYFTEDEDVVFKPMPSNYRSLYKGIIGAEFDNQIGYYMQENKVFLTNHPNMEEPKTVNVRMVLPLDGLGDDDEFVMMPIIQEALIMKALQFFSGQEPEDNLNDNQ